MTLPPSTDVEAVASALAPEPPLLPTPKADCGLGSRPETGLQGRVSPEDHESGRAAKGFTCNTELVGAYRKPNAIGTVGGFKVERYVDAAGHDCAYYDTTLMYPTNVLDSEGGVNVLDMSDPTKPTLTDRLLTPAMDTPHESLVLSHERGLLAAVAGNLATNVGVIDVYDISGDCRQPVLKSSTPVGFLGHESGLAPDGRTFYSASPASETLVAVDISNPSLPLPLWIGNYDSHGLSISRRRQPRLRRRHRLGADHPRHLRGPGPGAEPDRARDRPPAVELDEHPAERHPGDDRRATPTSSRSTSSAPGTRSAPGASSTSATRRSRRVVSNLRLEVHQPENFDAQADDAGQDNPVQGYAGHYCNVPTRVDPGIVACSMILSGLRVFDIRDPLNPREIAYFNAPVDPRIIPPAGIVPAPSNWAMSSPSFVPSRGEIWYSDGLSGFYAVRVTNGVWPFGGAGARRCLARRSPIGPRNIGRVRLGYSRAPAAAPAGDAGPEDPPLLPLLRQGQLGPRERGLLAPRARRARGHHRPRARKPRRAPRRLGAGAASRLFPPPGARTGPLPREPRQPPPDRRSATGGCASSRWPTGACCGSRRALRRHLRLAGL